MSCASAGVVAAASAAMSSSVPKRLRRPFAMVASLRLLAWRPVGRRGEE